VIGVAIVPAAGRGTRLGSITETTPKPMLDIAGRAALLRVLDGVVAAGIPRAVVVTGHLGEVVERGMVDAPLPVDTIRQDPMDGTATAVLAARHLAGDGPFMVTWGDALSRPEAYAAVADRWRRGADAVIAVDRVDDPAAGAAVWLAGDRVVEIVEKPPPGTVDTPWNNAGILVLPATAWEAIAAVGPSVRGEYELTDALVSLVSGGADVRAVRLEGPRIDIGTPERLARARRVFGGPNDPGSDLASG
jgi:NDP-sugar pyrophosphorylase family protein